MRVVIELKRGELSDVVLNNLYKQTPLQSVFGINMVGLVDGQPKLLSLKELLDAFLRHRREVVTRRTLYDLVRRANAPTYSKGSWWPCEHRRGHRVDPPFAVTWRGANSALHTRVEARRGHGHARAGRATALGPKT